MAKAEGTSAKAKKKSTETAHDHDHAHDHEHEHTADPADTGKASKKAAAKDDGAVAKARERLGAAGRNDQCPCGSGKKYKKCHLAADEAATIVPPTPPDAKELLTNGWRLFEQRRPGAAEKEFRAALELDATLQDAHVGIGMARLSAGNSEGAKEELTAVAAAGEAELAKFAKKEGKEGKKDKKDAFDQPELQPFIRAAHALGCLAYDEERYGDAVKELERVHSVDDGPVGIEARLISAKALMKQEKAADAVALLEPAAKLEGGAGRANLGLALAHFVNGAEPQARKALDAALEANAHYGKTLLGRIRRRVDNVAGAQPGSVEEALLYTQTYGDVWTDAAKKFLEKALDERAAAAATVREKAAPAAESAAQESSR
jgi:tetratricopeptide (TPR) repeat protein